MWPESSSTKAVNLVEKIYYNNWCNKFFLRYCFFYRRTLYIISQKGSRKLYIPCKHCPILIYYNVMYNDMIR